MNYKKKEADSLLQKLGIVLKPEDKDKDGKALLKVNIFCKIINSIPLTLGKYNFDIF